MQTAACEEFDPVRASFCGTCLDELSDLGMSMGVVLALATDLILNDLIGQEIPR